MPIWFYLKFLFSWSSLSGNEVPMRHLMVSGGRCEPTHQGSEGNICVTVNTNTGFKASRSFIADEILCRHYFSTEFHRIMFNIYDVITSNRPQTRIEYMCFKTACVFKKLQKPQLKVFFTLYSKIGMFEKTAFSLNFVFVSKQLPSLSS